VPSWQASFGDAPDGFIIKMVNLCRELKSGCLSGCPVRDPGLEENHLPVVPGTSHCEERERAGKVSTPLRRVRFPQARGYVLMGVSAGVVIAEDDG
jgi:hypothetical protein